MKKVGLAVSGGGIKSFAAIGVMRYMSEIGFMPETFSGTSMGSVIAGLAAIGMPITKIEETLLHLEEVFATEKIVTPSIRGLLSMTNGYTSSDIIETKLKEVLQEYGVESIRDVKSPLVITSVDLVSGNLVLFTNRKKQFIKERELIIIDDVPLATAITASCSFPLVFQPKVWKDMVLADGGIRVNLPIRELRSLGADIVLSVTTQSITEEKDFHSILNVSKRVMSLMLAQSTLQAIPLSDLNINVTLDTDNPFEAKYGKISIEKGYKQARKEKDDLLMLKKNAERLLPFFK